MLLPDNDFHYNDALEIARTFEIDILGEFENMQIYRKDNKCSMVYSVEDKIK